MAAFADDGAAVYDSGAQLPIDSSVPERGWIHLWMHAGAPEHETDLRHTGGGVGRKLADLFQGEEQGTSQCRGRYRAAYMVAQGNAHDDEQYGTGQQRKQ